MEAMFNTRPARRSIYKNGKKRPLIVRFFMGVIPMSGDGPFETVRKIIFMLAFIAFVYFGGSVVIDLSNEAIHQVGQGNLVRDIMQGKLNISQDVYDRVSDKVPEILPEYIGAYDMNNDFIGHVRIGNDATGEDLINLPVYQSADNEYYLEHAYDKTYNKGGAIFADYRDEIKSGRHSSNTILYGHNIMSGGYFTKLSRFWQAQNALDYYKKFPVVEFNTIYEKSKWKIFACGLYNTQEKFGEVYEYNNVINLTSKEAFDSFVGDIMDRSVLLTDVDLQYGDYLLTMSTCYYPMGESVDSRVVVFARKVRPGEDEFVDITKAVYNTKELRWAEQSRRYGSSWTGRVWDDSVYLR